MNDAQDKIVVFRVGDDLFAADVIAVERVLRHQPARAIPDVPEWIDGVIEYRQKMVPVINLRRRFELPPLEERPETRTLVMNASGDWIAVTVDSVLEVVGTAGDLTPPPPFFRGLAGEYVRGLVKRGDQLVVVLDVERLLSARERLRLEQAAAHDGSTTDDAAASPAESARPSAPGSAAKR